MKNKLFILIIQFLLISNYALSNTFKFESSNIEIVENGNIIYATGGKAISSDNNLEIEAEKFEYIKELDVLKTFKKGAASINKENIKIIFDESIIDQKNSKIQANGNIEIFQKEKKIRIFSDFVFYDIKKSEIEAKGNVKIIDFENDLTIQTKKIIYDKKNGIIRSNFETSLKDKSKNDYNAEEFVFEIEKNILKIKNANFKDSNNNNFKTSLAYVNTKTNKLFGKDAVVNLENSSFSNGNEPRLKGNSIINNNEVTEVSKGVFTTCKIRDEKCPPWKLSAEKIQHNKKKKIINYKNAFLSVYDIPVMYFPKFFHPDPTVKRRSGFLIPTIQDSSNTGNYLNVPYFFAISQNKDITISPRFYNEDKFLIQNEYRQINSTSSHFSDFSFFKDKGKNSKNHLFYNYDKSFVTNKFEETDIKLKIQKTSNDTYLKANKISSPLITNNNILENSFNLNLYSNNLSIETEVAAYETLNKGSNDRYEYILPKLNFIKKIENKTALNGDFTFQSSNLIRNFETNKLEKLNVNDFNFSSFPKITKFGFYNNYDFVIKNSNTDTENSQGYKTGENYYLSGLFQFNSTLPLIKENKDFQNIFTPKISLKIAPNQTKDDRDGNTRVDINNIYSLSRVTGNDTVEGGISLTYGTDYSIFDKKNQREELKFKIASNLRLEENHDLPTINQIGKKNSNIFSEITYSPNQYFTTKYNTSMKNNFSGVSYENLIGEFRINNFVTTFDYLNENVSEDASSYLTNTTSYNFDENNSISYSTRENKSNNLTEYYNWIYQYKNDCLAASIQYNKDYYNDRDVKPEESIFFKLTIIPFGETSSPNLKK